MTDVYLTATAWAFGTEHDVAELPELTDPAAVERLRAEGFWRYFQAVEQPWELATTSARHTLATWGDTPVDLVAYASESADRDDIAVAPAKLAVAVGLARTPVVVAAGNACANVGVLLRTARNWVLAGDADGVLVVTADTFAEGSRVVRGGAAVVSDSAASCVVTSVRPERGYLVRGFATAADSTLFAGPAVDGLAALRGSMDGIRRSMSALTGRLGVRPEDFKHVVTDNLGGSVIQMVCSVAGVDRARVRSSTADTGHCFAADALVNLGGLEPDAGAGDLVLALITGQSHWTCVALERV